MPLLRRQAGAPRFRRQGLTTRLRTTGKLFLRGLLALVGLVAVYLLAAIPGALVAGPLTPVPGPGTGAPIEIRLVAGPIHYDFLLPLTPRTRARFAMLRDAGLPLDHPGAEWLVIGWGSRAFYTHEGAYTDIPAATLWRAITGDDAVLRADLAGPLPTDYPARALRLTPPQYARLLDVIHADFRQGPTGALRPLSAPGFTDTDVFLESKGRFHILRTCNTWIARTLRRSGVAFGTWTPTPYAVTVSHRWFHTHLRARRRKKPS